ncbi:MAG TPA: helix-turn-helix domain-containing protein, partial [Pirellulaceae bacterium]
SGYHSLADPESPVGGANLLCPSPDVLACGSSYMIVPCRDGGPPQEMQYHVLRDTAGQLTGVVGCGIPPAVGAPKSDPRLDASTLHALLQQLRVELRDAYRVESLLGTSAAARRIRTQVAVAARIRANVLILGPRGSGRERVARTIFGLRDNFDVGLEPLDCSLLDAELLQSTVTAFLRRGAELQTAEVPGLLLLDVDHLEPGAQAELADLLAVDELAIRLFATSQVSPRILAREGRFRADLAEGLAEMEIPLPPLCERRDDVPLLAQAVLEQLQERHPCRVGGFEPAAMEILVAYDWPGQIPELQSTVRDCLEKAEGPRIGPLELPERLRRAVDPQTVRMPPPTILPLDRHLAEVEKQRIVSALRRAKGNKARAARLLGVSRTKLLRRISHFQIDDSLGAR